MRHENADNLFLLALCLYSGLGPVRIREILSALREEHVSPEQAAQLSAFQRRRLLGLSAPLHVVLDKTPQLVEKAALLAGDLETRGVSWIREGDKDYPPRLGHFMKGAAPLLIFHKGNLNLLHSPCFLGIVGTREPSHKGMEAARQISGEIAEKGAVIVSGGARGIDTCAHEAALRHSGTIIVLPYGLDHIKRLGYLARYLNRKNHLLLSEFAPFEQGNKSTPILRNRTVAALSDALLVIETGARGGTLHTVRFAREYSKPVLALDFSPMCNPKGNSSLLATVAESVPAFPKEREARLGMIMKALEKGKALVHKKSAVQNLLF